VRPYRLTVWHGRHVEVGAFSTFTEALDGYRNVQDSTKQLVNEDRAGCGRDGLTDEERDAVAEVAYAEEQSARVA
jgi:hypothetical protein